MGFFLLCGYVLAVIIFLVFVLILRTVYVLKKTANNAPMERRKPVKVMVVAGSGRPRTE